MRTRTIDDVAQEASGYLTVADDDPAAVEDLAIMLAAVIPQEARAAVLAVLYGRRTVKSFVHEFGK